MTHRRMIACDSRALTGPDLATERKAQADESFECDDYVCYTAF